MKRKKNLPPCVDGKTSGHTWVDRVEDESTRAVTMKCRLCGVKVKAENMPKHMARVHPEMVGK